MTVIFDKPRPVKFRGKDRMTAHLMPLDSGDLDSLHAAARKIGLKREWFQPAKTLANWPHYDLFDSKIEAARKAGIPEMAFRDFYKARTGKGETDD